MFLNEFFIISLVFFSGFVFSPSLQTTSNSTVGVLESIGSTKGKKIFVYKYDSVLCMINYVGEIMRESLMFKCEGHPH